MSLPDINPDLLDFQLNSQIDIAYPMTETWDVSAELYGISKEELMRRVLVTPTELNIIETKGTKQRPHVRDMRLWLPGHRMGQGFGVHQSQVMIVGKLPVESDLSRRRNLSGPVGEIIHKVFGKFDQTVNDFFATNVVRFMPPTGGKGPLKAHHVRDCAPLLAHEFNLVMPQFVLLLGSEAVKWVFGRKTTLKEVRGAVLPFLRHRLGQFPKSDDPDLQLIHEMSAPTVMATIHPSQLLREPAMEAGLDADIECFVRLMRGEQSRVSVSVLDDCDYRYISTADELNPLVDELIEAGHKQFAVDCEWAGSSPYDESGYLRTVQISWGPKKAVVVILRDEKGDYAFEPSQMHAVDALRRLLCRDGVQLIGHNFRADGLWLEELGVPVMRRLFFDTMLAQHVLNENAELDLSTMTIRYTGMGRYDLNLNEWLRSHPIKKSAGYGTIPDDILLPYSAADADATFRIFQILYEELGQAGNEALKFLYYYIEMPANQPIHDMEKNGLLVDTDRMTDLLWRYVERKNELLEELRRLIHWEEFNPRSFKQKAELFFYKPISEGGLELTPIKTTEKPPRMWEDIMGLPTEETDRLNPAVDMEVLDLLWLQAEQPYARDVIELVRRFQSIDQVTKNFLRPPSGVSGDEDENDLAFRPDLYQEGLLGRIDPDGRIRTSISQTKETGRYGSSRPNLQNLSKRQESRYKEIMGDGIPSLRSCFVARPGYVMIEADFKSAEVVALAYVSGDPQLIEDALGPVKLHAKVAVDVLKAPATYAEVADTHPHLYVGAKNINFGIPYQRGAKAIARQITRETKGVVTMEQGEAQDIIDAWYERYSAVRGYVNTCKRTVQNPPHHAETPYGRRRRFYPSESRGIMAAQERECVNFHIQSLVADALSVALFNLWMYKEKNPWCEFDILLAVHDAVFLEVPIAHVEHVMDFVLPVCMVASNKIPKLNFHLDIDPEIYLRWGEKPTREELERLGIPEKFWPKPKG